MSITKKRDGYLLTHPNGRAEYLTIWQAIIFRIIGKIPPLDYTPIAGITRRPNP